MTIFFNPSRKWHSTLFLRIVIPVVLVLILAIVALSWRSIDHLTTSKRQDLLNRNRLVAEQVAFAVHSSFYTLNWVFVEKMLESEVGSEEVLWLTILNPDNEIYLSSGTETRKICLNTAIDNLEKNNDKSSLSFFDEQTFLMTEPIHIGDEIWTVSLGGSLASISRIRKEIIASSLRIGIIIIFLSGMACLFISREITRPIVELSERAEEITQGKFNESLPVSSNDEIGKLAGSFNRMSVALQDSFAKNTAYRKDLENMVETRTRDLQQTTDRMTSILETSSQGFWQVDLDTIITKASPRMAEILNRKLEDIIGHSIYDFMDNNNAAILKVEFAKRQDGETGNYEISLLKRNGTLIPCLIDGVPLFDEQNRIIGAFAMVSDISWLKHTEEHLRKAKNTAEKANLAKSAFLANMSHEIRTPMNSIIGRTHLALNHELDQETRSHLEMISSSSESLLALINDILDFSKIESGKLELDSNPFDLEDTVESCLKTIRVLLEVKDMGVELTYTIGPDVPMALRGDALRLRQILLNLLSNSVKFTEKGNISLNITHQEKEDASVEMQFEIQDTGIGIALEKQAYIFDKFAQEDDSPTRKFAGTGLGLAICRKLCHLMGGDIKVVSTPGKGSTFSFTLPMQLCNIDELPAKQVLGAGRHTPIKPMSLLLVEDNEANRILANMVLQKEKHQVTEAYDGLHALELLSQQNFDAVVMDVQMPIMDGLTATRIIRAAERGSHIKELDEQLGVQLRDRLRDGHIPIIAMTANAMSGDREECIAMGMDDYIAKPFDPDMINVVFNKLTLSDTNSRAT